MMIRFEELASSLILIVRSLSLALSLSLSLARSPQTCSECKLKGANLGCVQKGCNQTFHYICAKESGCELDDESFSMFCQNHKVSWAIRVIGFEFGIKILD